MIPKVWSCNQCRIFHTGKTVYIVPLIPMCIKIYFYVEYISIHPLTLHHFTGSWGAGVHPNFRWEVNYELDARSLQGFDDIYYSISWLYVVEICEHITLSYFLIFFYTFENVKTAFKGMRKNWRKEAIFLKNESQQQQIIVLTVK